MSITCRSSLLKLTLSLATTEVGARDNFETLLRQKYYLNDSAEGLILRYFETTVNGMGDPYRDEYITHTNVWSDNDGNRIQFTALPDLTSTAPVIAYHEILDTGDSEHGYYDVALGAHVGEERILPLLPATAPTAGAATVRNEQTGPGAKAAIRALADMLGKLRSYRVLLSARVSMNEHRSIMSY